MEEVSNLYIPICGLFIAILCSISFFSKDRVKNKETAIFSRLLVYSLVDSLLMVLIIALAIWFEDAVFWMKAFNKIDYAMYILWSSNFFLYVYYVTAKDNEHGGTKYYNFFFYATTVIDIIIMIMILFGKVNLHNYGSTRYSDGSSLTFAIIGASFYIIAIIVCLIINSKKVLSRKLTPLYTLILLIILVVIMNQYDKNIVIVSAVLAYINLIMLFTIENPDLKMAKQLELAKEQAEKANRAKTDFLSSMSHEIRTPLNAIVGFSDEILEAKSLGEAQENAHDIVNASQTLLEIVNGILDISKIEAGKIEIVNSSYNANELFEELAKLITPKMKEKGLDFSYNIAPDLPKTLYGDHANLKKIVTNLLSNACKYTERGFVHYEVNCVNSKDVSKLIISVEDSGRGIKKDNIDKMFTKFQRLDEDRNTTIEGTGLGLAITKQLIELMGGRIIVHTVYGEGSKFTVVLNQKIAKEEVQEKKQFKTTLDLNNIRILLVDDTPLNLKVTCKLLQRYNANQIVTCDSGFECLERIQRGEIYDLILLDDMMPKMSGVETLKKLKEIPGFRIPTIALTANAITGMREKYLADGFDDYLAKPIEKEQLIQVINQVLGRSLTEELNVQEKVDRAIEGPISPSVHDEKSLQMIEEVNNNEVIPVEENIEEILGDKLNINYKEKDDKKLDSDVHTDILPVVDIDIDTGSSEKVYDRKYLEENGVDVNHALELLGDMEMYNMTINDFMNDVEDKWNRIVSYKNQNNMADYAVEVHSLKSDCKYLGFMKLADISYQHELKSKENDSEFVNNNFYEFENEYKNVLDIVKNYIKYNKN